MVFRLIFRSPLHVGADSVGYEGVSEMVHSDTILAALYSLALKVNPSLADAIKKGLFRISSGFPFYSGENEMVYFFPKPIWPQDNLFFVDEDNYQLYKSLKKLKFLPDVWFREILNGRSIKVSKESINSYYSKLEEISKTRTLPKVVQGRISQNSFLYHYGEMHFYKGGLFILAEFEDEALRAAFHGLLNLLGDEGLGGRRTAGYGLFTVEADEMEFELPPHPTRFITLSLYWPNSEELQKLNLGNSSYQLIPRSGWFLLDDGRSYRRKLLWMFREGSILNIKPKGDVADVTPRAIQDKHVYRFGYAVSLPFMPKHNSKEE